MGGRGSRSMTQAQTTPRTTAAPPPQPAPQQQAQPTPQQDDRGFSATDRADYHDLYNGQQYYNRQNLTVDQQLATMQYLSMTPEAGTMYSMAQNMNTALATGKKLTANQQYVYNEMMSAMHNLGYNLKLQRYDHASFVNDMLRSSGVRGNLDSMTDAQLKKALVGRTYTEKRLTSTTYNDFKNAADPSTFTTRQVKIEYRAKASARGMMPGNGPGGRLGEIVLAPNQTTRIVDIYRNGKKARAQRTQSMTKDQVTIVVEVG